MRPALRRHDPSRVSTGRTLNPNGGQGITVFGYLVVQISDRWRRCDESDVGIRVNATAYSHLSQPAASAMLKASGLSPVGLDPAFRTMRHSSSSTPTPCA